MMKDKIFRKLLLEVVMYKIFCERGNSLTFTHFG